MDHTRFAIMPLGAALSAALLVGGCSAKAPDPLENPQAPAYVVGLGEIMGLNQMRHAKLWFAGQAGNWPLAAYEIDELREGFTDAELYHEHHKSVPEPLTQIDPRICRQAARRSRHGHRAQEFGRFRHRLRCADKGMQWLPPGRGFRLQHHHSPIGAALFQPVLRTG